MSHAILVTLTQAFKCYDLDVKFSITGDLDFSSEKSFDFGYLEKHPLFELHSKTGRFIELHNFRALDI